MRFPPEVKPSLNTILPPAVSLIFSLSLACSSGATTQNSNPGPKASDSQAAKTDNHDAEFQTQLDQIAAAAKGHVGVAALVLETGETIYLNHLYHYPTQSVYKLPIDMAVMKQADAGKIKLEQKVRVAKSDFVRAGQHSPIRDKNPNGAELTVDELLRFAISESDGTASDVLMKIVGGPQTIQAYLTELTITDMIVLNTEKEIGQDWQTQYRN